jgi:hypothetical protein
MHYLQEASRTIELNPYACTAHCLLHTPRLLARCDAMHAADMDDIIRHGQLPPIAALALPRHKTNAYRLALIFPSSAAQHTQVVPSLGLVLATPNPSPDNAKPNTQRLEESPTLRARPAPCLLHPLRVEYRVR